MNKEVQEKEIIKMNQMNSGAGKIVNEMKNCNIVNNNLYQAGKRNGEEWAFFEGIL